MPLWKQKAEQWNWRFKTWEVPQTLKFFKDILLLTSFWNSRCVWKNWRDFVRKLQSIFQNLRDHATRNYCASYSEGLKVKWRKLTLTSFKSIFITSTFLMNFLIMEWRWEEEVRSNSENNYIRGKKTKNKPSVFVHFYFPSIHFARENFANPFIFRNIRDRAKRLLL